MARTKILLVDDEPDVLDLLQVVLRVLPEVDVETESDSAVAVQKLSTDRYDLLVTDLRMPKIGGLELIQTARGHDPELTVLVLTGFPELSSAVECMKLGAVDYVTKPVATGELLSTVQRLLDERRLRRENSLLMRQVQRPYRFAELMGESPSIQAVRAAIHRIAPTDLDVLITGETGVGKELVARLIHRGSPRKGSRFVPVDCSAIPESLMESEFFGHQRGAFTGAHEESLGLFEFADGGTLFLDEVAELPLGLQAKLLRALQERSIRRVGGKEEIVVNLRIIAATNKDLSTQIREKRFRDDLYYRINVARIDVPRLSERGADITLLAGHFVARYAEELGLPPITLTPEGEQRLLAYPWPGNVRELQNVIRRSLTMLDGTALGPDALPPELRDRAMPCQPALSGGFFEQREQRLLAFERQYLVTLLQAHKGEVAPAAERAELPLGTLYRLLRKHRIKPEQFR